MAKMDKALRGEVLDSLQHRIKTERSMLHHRLTRQEQLDDEQTLSASRWRRTGKLYEVFQALSYGENE
jgi:hypothetical protein